MGSSPGGQVGKEALGKMAEFIRKWGVQSTTEADGLRHTRVTHTHTHTHMLRRAD
jgi:hypothetical protein